MLVWTHDQCLSDIFIGLARLVWLPFTQAVIQQNVPIGQNLVSRYL